MSFSDISDLTDISSSDSEDDVPLTKRISKAKKGPKEYKISHVLRPPRTAQYTAKSLYDQIIDNSIDLDPEYQRDVVWQEEKQSGLIDSILRNYYIPPIIFAVTVQDDGSELRTCIDGKQRLTSIQRFIDGHIPHKDSFTNEKLWFKSTATGTRRKLLPQYLKTQFTNKQIVCVEYTDLDGDQEREIFQRVQLGVALTPAERLQALVGPWSTVIREIQNQVLGEEGFEGYLDWGHARGRDFQCLATIGYFIENYPKTTIPGAKALEKWLQKAQPVCTQLRAELHETFRIFVTLARDKKYSGSLNQPTRVSPIEFVMIGVLIYLKRQTLSLTQISSAIEKMRKDVRASHKDIRSNTRIAKHLMEFMAKKIKVSELRKDGEGNIPASRVIAKTTKLTKRKRPTYSDDSDSEPAPKTKAKSAKSSTNSSAEAVKSSKQPSSAADRKKSAPNKSIAAPDPTTAPAKPSQATTSSHPVDNSLSNPLPMSTTKSSLPPPTQPSGGPISQPPPSTSNEDGVDLRPTTSNSVPHTPLTIQTSPVMKAESPQMSSLNSPAILSAVDRLAPIRAAKASLASGNVAQSPVSKDSEIRTVLNHPGANASQSSVDLRQIPLVPSPAVYQTTTQHPLPPPSTLSQHLPANSSQGRLLPARVEEVLRTLRSQYPQLGDPNQSTSNGAISPATFGPSNSVTPPSISTPATIGEANNFGHISQGGGVGTSQGTCSGIPTHSQTPPNQPASNALPPWLSYNSGTSTNVTSQFPQPPSTSVGTHALPQRPSVVPKAPKNFMWAEPLGPRRSESSDGAAPDGPRGPYNRDRHRPPDDNGRYSKDRHRRSDDRGPKRHDPNYDYGHDKRSWSRSRS